MRNDRWATDSEIKAALRCFLGDKGTGGPVLYHHNGVCYVDLSKDIENALPGLEEKVMVYAMVNSITALGNATSVQFTVDGEKMESLRDFDSFHLMMTNDYSLVDSAIKGTKQ